MLEASQKRKRRRSQESSDFSSSSIRFLSTTNDATSSNESICQSLLIELPSFDPKNEIQGARAWIDRVEDIFTRINLRDPYIVPRVAHLLKGSAFVWYNTEGRRAANWAELRSMLITYFPSRVILRDVIQQLGDTTSDRFETYDEYARRKLYIWRMFARELHIDKDLSEIHLVQIIISGIDDDQLRTVLHLSKISTLKDLFRRLATCNYQHNKRTKLNSSESLSEQDCGRSNQKTDDDARFFQAPLDYYLCMLNNKRVKCLPSSGILYSLMREDVAEYIGAEVVPFIGTRYAIGRTKVTVINGDNQRLVDFIICPRDDMVLEEAVLGKEVLKVYFIGTNSIHFIESKKIPPITEIDPETLDDMTYRFLVSPRYVNIK